MSKKEENVKDKKSGQASEKSPVKKDRKEKTPRQEPQGEEKTGKESSTGKMVALGLIVFFFAIALSFYLYYFHGGGRDFIKNKYAKKIVPATTTDPNKENENFEEAMKMVKETKGEHTYMSIEQRLRFYKTSREKELGKRILTGQWRVDPSPGKEEKGRYYDVFHDWTVKGKKVTFVWLVDLKEKKVIPSSDHSKKLDDFDKTVYDSIATRNPGDDSSKTDKKDEAMEKGDKEGKDKKNDGKPELKPLNKKGTSDVNIIPPERIDTGNSDDMQPIPADPEAMGLDESTDSRIQLRGFVSKDGARKAIILDGSSYREVKAGESLSGGWKISSVGTETVTISNGYSVKSLKVTNRPLRKPQRGSTTYRAKSGNYPAPGEYTGGDYPAAGNYRGGSYPKAGQYSGKGNYPRAGELSGNSYPKAGESVEGDYPRAVPPNTAGRTPRINPGKPPAGGPPVIPAPGGLGEGPPIPPPPGKKPGSSEIPMPNNAPKDEPTIIPLD